MLVFLVKFYSVLLDTTEDRACFVQGPEGDKVVKMAISAPEKYVLKPQREGGGGCKNTHAYTCTHALMHMCTCMHAQMHTHTHTHTHAHAHTRTHSSLT